MKKIILLGTLFLVLLLVGCTQDDDTGVDLTNCRIYFNGCNTCYVVDGQIAGCTEKGCESVDGGSGYEEPECLEYY